MNTFEIIWQIAGKIPEGKVATYGQLAFLAGNPRLSRIVGCAMHSAPDTVPCHREVDRSGRLSPVLAPMALHLSGPCWNWRGSPSARTAPWICNSIFGTEI